MAGLLRGWCTTIAVRVSAGIRERPSRFLRATPRLPSCTQISAVQAALDKVALGLLDEHARSCVADATQAKQGEMTDEMMAAVARLMRRG